MYSSKRQSITVSAGKHEKEKQIPYKSNMRWLKATKWQKTVGLKKCKDPGLLRSRQENTKARNEADLL
jgi:hypothetical protein